MQGDYREVCLSLPPAILLTPSAPMRAEEVSRTAGGRLKKKFHDGTVAKGGVLPQALFFAITVASFCFKPSTGSPTHSLSPVGGAEGMSRAAGGRLKTFSP